MCHGWITGTCGWYVSYNATRGISIFKIDRDNEYITKMLKLLRLFKNSKGRDGFQNHKELYDEFANLSVQKSKSIKKWKHVLPDNI